MQGSNINPATSDRGSDFRFNLYYIKLDLTPFVPIGRLSRGRHMRGLEGSNINPTTPPGRGSVSCFDHYYTLLDLTPIVSKLDLTSFPFSFLRIFPCLTTCVFDYLGLRAVKT